MRFFAAAIYSLMVLNSVFANNISNVVNLDEALKLKNITLYNSGINYYEYQGILKNNTSLKMSFSRSQISDILKSITIIDPKAEEISFRFDSGLDTISNGNHFGINPKIALTLSDFLAEKKGFMLEVKANSTVRGRILAVKNSGFNSSENPNDTISLFDDGEIVTIKFSDIESFKFLNEDINKELGTILALMESEGSSSEKNLYLNIKSDAKRDVRLAYVMEAPLYKISYRAFLEDKNALFQAWAFINNPNSFDWKDVEISLMSSKPYSYVQDLYTPTYKYREEVGFINELENGYSTRSDSADMMEKTEKFSVGRVSKNLATGEHLFKGGSKEKNDQFSFLIPNKVTILKHQNLAVPLISANLPMEKFSLLADIKPYAKETNGVLAVELENNSSLRLPGGVVAMYDDGSYIGDAKMDYLAVNDKAVLKFGEDENLIVSRSDKKTENLLSIGVRDGLVKQSTKSKMSSTYLIKNKDIKEKKIVLEHPKNKNQTIETEIKPYEEKSTFNRYKFVLAPKEELKFTINAVTVVSSSYELVKLDENRLKFYISNDEIPERIKTIFKEILEKGKLLRDRRENLKNMEEKQNYALKSQERARENLKAVGSENSNANKFLEQILKDEKTINEINKDIQKTKYDIEILERELEKFIEKIKV